MLLRFEVSNHRSIMQPAELSMIAVDADRPAARGFETLNEHVLTVAGIYGPNASGKSNVIESLVWLAGAVRSSLRYWTDFVPREPFRFGPGPATPSTYEVEMVVDGVRYAYVLEVDDSAVLFEGLYHYPERRRRVLFERDGMELSFRRGLGGLAGTRELLTPTTLALSAAMRFDERDVVRFGRALGTLDGLGLRVPSQPERIHWALTGFHATRRLFDERTPTPTPFEDAEAVPLHDRETALALIRLADHSIDDVRVIEAASEEAGTSAAGQRRPRRLLRLVHRISGQELVFSPDEESAGTQTWFTLVGPVLGTIRSGRILLFDEISSRLHPHLSSRLVELFQDPETNPRGAQLIFTTHDTSLLNHLNRDEVWLTEKGPDGATTLTALAEFGGDKVRRSLNLEKAYLQGRFGAVPEVDQFVLRQALGLTSRAA
jgi:hypothetical protein